MKYTRNHIKLDALQEDSSELLRVEASFDEW